MKTIFYIAVAMCCLFQLHGIDSSLKFDLDLHDTIVVSTEMKPEEVLALGILFKEANALYARQIVKNYPIKGVIVKNDTVFRDMMKAYFNVPSEVMVEILEENSPKIEELVAVADHPLVVMLSSLRSPLDQTSVLLCRDGKIKSQEPLLIGIMDYDPQEYSWNKRLEISKDPFITWFKQYRLDWNKQELKRRIQALKGLLQETIAELLNNKTRINGFVDSYLSETFMLALRSLYWLEIEWNDALFDVTFTNISELKQIGFQQIEEGFLSLGKVKPGAAMRLPITELAAACSLVDTSGIFTMSPATSDYIFKPIDPETLHEVIERYLLIHFAVDSLEESRP